MLLQLSHVLQEALFRQEHPVLSRLQLGTLQLLEGKLQIRVFLFTLGLAGLHQLQLAPRRAQLQKLRSKHLPVRRHIASEEGIEKLDVVVAYQQRLWLMLSVNIHQTLAHESQRAEGNDAPVDAILVPAGSIHLARGDHSCVLVCHEVTQHIPQRSRPGKRKRRVQPESVGAGTDEVAGQLAAQDSADGPHKDRLARPCLTGDDVESVGERHMHIVCDGHVVDVEFLQHSHSPQWNLAPSIL